jgi:hypothetical protein
MSIPNDPTQSVKRMLELLKQEWPEYMTDNDQMIAAAIALSHVLGALGAVVLIKGGEGRLEKMLRMITTNVNHTSHEGARAINSDRRTREVIDETGRKLQ